MKRYFIWKDASHAGEEDNWLEISGKEFYELVSNKENAHRRFITWFDEDGECKDIITYEVTNSAYLEWDRNRKYQAYRNQRFYEEKILFVDWDEVLYYDEDEPITIADTIADPDAYHETTNEECLIEDLKDALKCLSAEERHIIDLIFLDNPDNKSDRQIARELGIPAMTLNSRKKAILKKLKKNFVQN